MSYKYKINTDYITIKDNIKNITTIFKGKNKTIHKARNELKIIEINKIQTVVKSFKKPNFINQIIYSFFRKSKAKKSYEYALKIKDFTPQPIAYIEFYNYSLLKNSYFISEYFHYDFTIREPLLQNNFPEREKIFRAFAHFTFQLHNNNILHNDYSPGNILIKKENDNYIFKIVDINRMSFKSLSLQERAKNFSQLWADDEILLIMINEYEKYYPTNIKFKQNVLYFSNQHKKRKNFKKRLKGKKIYD